MARSLNVLTLPMPVYVDDCALIDYAITAAAALAAADDDLGEEYIEVVCPHGSRPGDVLDVRLPHGGTVRASVPAGVVLDTLLLRLTRKGELSREGTQSQCQR